MTGRKVPRREILAFIALNTDEASAPTSVEFREYTGDEGRDWYVIELQVDSEAAVRYWAGVFGHPERYLYRREHTRADGTRWTMYRSQADGWRGFTTVVGAAVDEPAPDVQLDDATREQLAELANGGERNG